LAQVEIGLTQVTDEWATFVTLGALANSAIVSYTLKLHAITVLRF